MATKSNEKVQRETFFSETSNENGSTLVQSVKDALDKTVKMVYTDKRMFANHVLGIALAWIGTVVSAVNKPERDLAVAENRKVNPSQIYTQYDTIRSLRQGHLTLEQGDLAGITRRKFYNVGDKLAEASDAKGRPTEQEIFESINVIIDFWAKDKNNPYLTLDDLLMDADLIEKDVAVQTATV